MNAPGSPGNPPTWASSAKDLVGTARGSSRVWYTIGYGILNEVFWPSCSLPQIRDLGFIVAGDDFWCEVKREHNYTISTPDPAIPLANIVHRHDRYQLDLEILSDPMRDAVLVHYELHGEGLRLYVLLAPHLGSSGHHNDAWVAPQALMAANGPQALALMADGGIARGSAGYVGSSDGWQDFRCHGAMTWQYGAASDGNVALTAELESVAGTLALAFAQTPEGAKTLAHSALASGHALARSRFIEGWKNWSKGLEIHSKNKAISQAARRAAMVLKVHDDRTFRGAVVASLSSPWGASRDDPGGYHLVWPRDAVQAGFAFLACGQHTEARTMLAYLIATQQADGHWLQNNFGDGRPYWTGIQLDEAALPVLLAAKLDEASELGDMRPLAQRMVRAALAFVARTGPFSEQDRWEENAGVNPYTLAAAIAALVAGAEHGFLDAAARDYALSLADDWNQHVEHWVYVRDTELDRKHGIHGHYVRISPPGEAAQTSCVVLKNRNNESLPASELLGLEFLALVRLGLRPASDVRIRDSVKLIDATLRVETPTGVFYHRYNEDGYGEHADGRPFDGSGIGRAWPLLAGERGHYALDAGEDPVPYLESMLGSASQGGMIPEQVWDCDAIPGRHLEPGQPTGSAMPLVWAHAEFLKLAAAAQCGAPIERLAVVAKRYHRARRATVVHWRETSPCDGVDAKVRVSIEATEPFELHFGHDGWQGATDRASTPIVFGLYGVELDVAALGATRSIEFTRHFLGPRGWEQRNWQIAVGGDPA
ncbi:MAG: glucan 1,4-alpha-glucosidase [Nevskiaceae bacterium]|nr:MAG: glucan 1,4-alpha-glucosidase [Nevskiaceae bacterium]TBR73883.1 MAG: glucan 1,4-alpha-glucosidase [Nevskiaceae bacterium]